MQKEASRLLINGKPAACISEMSNKLRLAIHTCTHLLGIAPNILSILLHQSTQSVGFFNITNSRTLCLSWRCLPEVRGTGETSCGDNSRERTTEIRERKISRTWPGWRTAVTVKMLQEVVRKIQSKTACNVTKVLGAHTSISQLTRQTHRLTKIGWRSSLLLLLVSMRMLMMFPAGDVKINTKEILLPINPMRLITGIATPSSQKE